MNTQEKINALNHMHWQWAQCQGCLLCQKRKNVVFGYGNPDAKIMIVGEAPGAHEDEQGIPFVGNSGQLLDQILAQASANEEIVNLVSDQENYNPTRLRQLLLNTYFYTNVVACRPPENRDPTPTEVETCRSRLLGLIYIVDPVLIITVGAIATSAVVGKKIAITTARGELYDVDIQGHTVSYKKPVLAMLHPSYLLRMNDFKQEGGHAQNTYFDALKALHILDEHLFQDFQVPRPRDGSGCIRCGKEAKVQQKIHGRVFPR